MALAAGPANRRANLYLAGLPGALAGIDALHYRLCRLFLRLPESGLEIDIPLTGTFPVTPQPDAGVEPDVAITQTASDIASGRDRVLDTALRFARDA